MEAPGSGLQARLPADQNRALIGGILVTASAKGRSLELFFIDGKPDGMLTAEVFNWTGHVLMTPRTQIGEALRREEMTYAGVYLLFGEKDGEPLAYIGEAEDVSERIRNHDTRKDWWTSAVLVTSTANNLNKAHVKYLEARLVEEAKSIGKIELENARIPALPSLSEAARSNMEAFLDYLLMVLPALRIDAFVRSTRPTTAAVPQGPAMAVNSPVFELHNVANDLHAKAQLIDGDFVVLAGSSARRAWAGTGTEDSSYARLHAELVRNGILVEKGPQRVFGVNYAFKSPSAAAAVVNGRSANGTIEWKIQGQGKTYKQWEAETLGRDDGHASEEAS